MRILLSLLCCALCTQALTAQKILPTRLLHLSEDNLAKIGVRITDSGITFLENVASDNGQIRMRKILLSKNAVSVVNAKKSDLSDSRNFAPVFAVNTFSNGSASYYHQPKDIKTYTLPDSVVSGTSAALIDTKWASSLVGVVVEFTPKSKKPTTNTAYLWYKPTTEFIDALPDDFAEPIWSETILGDRGIVASQDGNFTDSWRSVSDILTPNLYPNPVRDSKATIEFTLQSPASLTIIIFDITGNKIRELFPLAPYSQGKQTLELPLNSLDDGMYLVAIMPENRQPVVQRLLIAR